jgi:hypothetical protein
MQLDTPMGTLQFVNEAGHTFGSVDNVRRYPFSKAPSDGYISSTHGVLLNGEPLAVFGNGGGASGIHAHSAVSRDNVVYLAVGSHVVCFEVMPFVLRWEIQADDATCFGIYFCPLKNALLSHGELEIARFSENGEIIWSAGGADIFTEGFTLHVDCIEAIDFNKKKYYFCYEDGTVLASRVAPAMDTPQVKLA